MPSRINNNSSRRSQPRRAASANVPGRRRSSSRRASPDDVLPTHKTESRSPIPFNGIPNLRHLENTLNHEFADAGVPDDEINTERWDAEERRLQARLQRVRAAKERHRARVLRLRQRSAEVTAMAIEILHKDNPFLFLENVCRRMGVKMVASNGAEIDPNELRDWSEGLSTISATSRHTTPSPPPSIHGDTQFSDPDIKAEDDDDEAHPTQSYDLEDSLATGDNEVEEDSASDEVDLIVPRRLRC